MWPGPWSLTHHVRLCLCTGHGHNGAFHASPWPSPPVGAYKDTPRAMAQHIWQIVKNVALGHNPEVSGL